MPLVRIMTTVMALSIVCIFVILPLSLIGYGYWRQRGPDYSGTVTTIPDSAGLTTHEKQNAITHVKRDLRDYSGCSIINISYDGNATAKKYSQLPTTVRIQGVNHRIFIEKNDELLLLVLNISYLCQHPVNDAIPQGKDSMSLTLIKDPAYSSDGTQWITVEPDTP
ncbi:hypothetical protein DF200_08450 [Bifidobacterium catulorum]|uniref:Uncharacterized protein n=2 Tax=Bifidobacterium catulorum TaxID=1630173 RepID=A0A2U2MR26_9BIFI|nr:hypothetical protein DF200_08450 [Bifidobacterium catulorum]